MSKHTGLKWIGLLLCMLIAFPSWSEVYKWKDAQGRIHFGDTPPNVKKAQDITAHTHKINISKDSSTPKMIKHYEQQKEQERNRKYNAYQQAQQARNSQPNMKEKCRGARIRLNTIQGRVYFTDKSGKTFNVSERERQKMAAKLEKQIREHCK